MGLMDKVKETAQKGVDATKGAVSATQEKIEDTKLKKKISDLKEELGGIVYAQRTGTVADDADPEAEITRIVEAIQAAEAEAAED